MRLLLAILIVLLTVPQVNSADLPRAFRILYVTSLPGTYHDYVTQREIFLETAKKAGWQVTVIGRVVQN